MHYFKLPLFNGKFYNSSKNFLKWRIAPVSTEHVSVHNNIRTNGTRKGSLNDSTAATVSTGSMQENIAPMSSMRPVRGSTGSLARWKPKGVKFSSSSRALICCNSCRNRCIMSIRCGQKWSVLLTISLPCYTVFR